MAIPVQLDMKYALPAQLATAPRETTHVNLETDIPSDSDWALLSSHFTSVTHLYMDSGWNERVGDAGIPLHWPLEKITIGSACADVCTSPWIIEGRAKHLVLYYTAGLRFEGPTTEELIKANREAIERGEKEAYKVGNLTINYVPDLARDWLREKFEKEKNERNVKEEDTSRVPYVPLRTLEIIENDVHDTLLRYVLAHPSLVDPVETLNLVAPGPNDLELGPENVLHGILPQLKALNTLVLTVGDNYSSRELLPNLVQAFANPTFLPNLKSISFVLDLKDGEEVRKKNEEYQTAAKAEAASDTQEESETVVEAAKGLATEEAVVGAMVSQHANADVEVEIVQDESETNEEAVLVIPPASSPSLLPSPSPSPALPEVSVSDEVLAQAKRACEQLWRAAEGRGVVVEPWSVVQSRREPWELPKVSESDEVALGESTKEFKSESRPGEDSKFTGIKPVDQRWEKL
ncbi:hypothetical protein BT96DRAFT_944665 [Gymnopus androsaceus JB14]|uniref:Uncharacterized protein n=1 Tax=Gymnopus androsaceus JB14 TaxID=1447944 RepID=A0A6A4H4X6_9AGAR|nr:hypothetical protein BT96DRAFT_944665 [Gymnopus androsaceus JB14]